MSRIQCRKCGYVSQRAINCAHCGGDYTMQEIDEEKDDMRERIATLEAALRKSTGHVTMLAQYLRDSLADSKRPVPVVWTGELCDADESITAARAVLEKVKP